MAKKRIVVHGSREANANLKVSDGRAVFDISLIAACFLGGTVVYVLYHPSDAAAVESGDALWFCLLAMVTGLLACLSDAVRYRGFTASAALDTLALGLGAWIGIAALGCIGIGNLRSGTNEAWVWIAGAMLLVGIRRLAIHVGLRRALLGLLITGATGLAVHGLHQELVTLPMNRAAFEQDPDSVIAQAGLDAPGGSAERAIFAGRLYDGGPSATFALANSLAAWLLAGVLSTFGLLVFQWRACSRWQRFVVIACLAACVAGLLATRSRSGAIAAAIGIGWTIWLTRQATLSAFAAPRRTNPSTRRNRLAILVGGLGLLAVAIIGFARPTLLSVPSSLAFRFQYWQATLRMAIDRPWFGAGPGNFQAIYEQYRDASAAEQIADPHNFMMETLGSGGWIGLVLLTAIMLLGMQQTFTRVRRRSVESEPVPTDHGSAVWVGAVIACVMIWLFGFATRQLPDIDASLYVVPVAAATAFLTWPMVNQLPVEATDRIAIVVLAMTLLHLMVSGGWTVPGVAVLVWLAVGFVTRVNDDREPTLRTPQISRQSVAIAIGCGMLIVLLCLVSIHPVTNARHQLEIAHRAAEAGQWGRSLRALRNAVAADRWSPIPQLMLADYYRWRLIAQDSDATRKLWQLALAEARERAGEDPALLRAIGVQQIHVYQRHGQSADLTAAMQTFQQAVEWSPADQWLAAEFAVILAAIGDQTQFQEFAQRARDLAKLGINTERRLAFQQIYPAKSFGSQTLTGPIRRSASLELDELGTLADRNDVESQPDR